MDDRESLIKLRDDLIKTAGKMERQNERWEEQQKASQKIEESEDGTTVFKNLNATNSIVGQYVDGVKMDGSKPVGEKPYPDDQIESAYRMINHLDTELAKIDKEQEQNQEQDQGKDRDDDLVL